MATTDKAVVRDRLSVAGKALFAVLATLAWAGETPKKLTVDEVLAKVDEAQTKVADAQMDLEMEMKGEATVRLANQEFTVASPGSQRVRHQLMVYESAPPFEITATGPCHIKRIEVKLAEF